MEQTFNHQVIYTNHGSVTVREVATSLLANEALIRDAVGVLEDIFPGLEVLSLDLNFRSATTASPLKELIAGAIFLAYQDELTTEVPALIERLGLPIPDEMNTLITVMVMLIAVYGISKAMTLFKDKAPVKAESAPPTTPLIEGNYNEILIVMGDLTGVGTERISEALDARFKGAKAKSVAKRALDFIAPAKAEVGAGVQGAGVAVTPETVAAAPQPWEIDLSEDAEIQEPYQAQTVVIHATDLDSTKSGWAGHLPGLHEKRLRMRLYPTIGVDDLYGQRSVSADIILVSKLNGAGDYVPYMFHVVRLHT